MMAPANDLVDCFEPPWGESIDTLASDMNSLPDSIDSAQSEFSTAYLKPPP